MKGSMFAVAALLCLWLFSDRLPFGNEITIYPLFCIGNRNQGKCAGEEQTANPTTYKVIVEQQTVIFWTDNSDVPERFAHCAVRNTRNWTCESTLGIRDRMIDGDLIEIAPPPFISEQANFYPVPKWRWWSVWLLQKMK